MKTPPSSSEDLAVSPTARPLVSPFEKSKVNWPQTFATSPPEEKALEGR